MGLFSKEACTFCGKEVGAMHRSKLKSKEYICSDCRRRLNAFARMDYTTRDDAQKMMDTLGADVEWLNAEVDKLQKDSRFAVMDNDDFTLGSKQVNYRVVKQLGVFMLYYSDIDRYEYCPVLRFDKVIPYQFESDNAVLNDTRRREIMDQSADYVTWEISKDMDGKINGCSVTIPYQDDCIQQIKISSSVSDEAACEPFKKLAEKINNDRRAWLSFGLYDEQRKNEMQLRNLGDTAAAALKAAAKGESVEQAVAKGIETANAIEEGKVKKGLFGKLFKK